MSASNWNELVGMILTVLGAGGVMGIGKLTRIAVAAEQLGKQLQELGGQLATVTTAVSAHETRIAVLENQPGKSSVQ
jgi:hypothetical protein